MLNQTGPRFRNAKEMRLKNSEVAGMAREAQRGGDTDNATIRQMLVCWIIVFTLKDSTSIILPRLSSSLNFKYYIHA